MLFCSDIFGSPAQSAEKILGDMNGAGTFLECPPLFQQNGMKQDIRFMAKAFVTRNHV